MQKMKNMQCIIIMHCLFCKNLFLHDICDFLCFYSLGIVVVLENCHENDKFYQSVKVLIITTKR